jgi:hypothetical protein
LKTILSLVLSEVKKILSGSPSDNVSKWKAEFQAISQELTDANRNAGAQAARVKLNNQ